MPNFHTPMHFEIPVDDMDRASAFYKGLFGWEITSSGPDFTDYYMVITVPQDGSVPGINGGMMKRADPSQQPLNYISVENMDEYLGKVEKLGGVILMPKMPVKGIGWNAVCQDTEKNTFGLFQNDKNAA